MADRIVVMNGGRVEQVGSPLELYDTPQNLFVAGFIGSPAMNLLPGRVAGGRFVSPTRASQRRCRRTLPLRGRQRGRRRDPAGPTGARRGGRAGRGRRGRADRSGDAGGAQGRRLHFHALIRDRMPLRPGDTVGVTVQPGGLHLFDAATWPPALTSRETSIMPASFSGLGVNLSNLYRLSERTDAVDLAGELHRREGQGRHGDRGHRRLLRAAGSGRAGRSRRRSASSRARCGRWPRSRDRARSSSFWITTANLRWRDLILRIYWDGQDAAVGRVPARRLLLLGLEPVRAGDLARGLREPRAGVQLLLGDAVPQGARG